MQIVTDKLEIRHNSKDEYDRREQQDDYQVTEHRKGLRSRIGCKAEWENIGEGHNSEWEQYEDVYRSFIMLVKNVKKDLFWSIK